MAFRHKTPQSIDEFREVYDNEIQALNSHVCANLLDILVKIHYAADPVEKLILSDNVNPWIDWISQDCIEQGIKSITENVTIEDPIKFNPVRWLEDVLDGWPQFVLKEVNNYLDGGFISDLFRANKKPRYFSTYELASDARRYRDDEKKRYDDAKSEIELLRHQRDVAEDRCMFFQQRILAVEREKARLQKERYALEQEKEHLQKERESLEDYGAWLEAKKEAKATDLKQTDTAPESTSKAPAKTKEKKPIKVKFSKVPNSFHPELTAKAKLLYGRLLILTSFAKKQCVYTNQQAQKDLHFGPRSTNRYFKELRDAKLLTTTNTSDHPNAQSINVRMVELSIEAMPPKRAKS
ncbi:hypothetical protein [uncultured Anaerobiospirillum sp.]|uniref:hypothetical protein n=1 Tax=uncultured Anaerobiospirillum sp. TaxID=265728 RepID=UPI002804CCE7|nr:hypothetical protein [uncultured Anaerobiospirillum sp.]